MTVTTNARTRLFELVRSAINEKIIAILIGVLITLIMSYQLIFITRYPTVFIDEPWYANAAWNWMKNGVNYDSMHAGTREYVIWPAIGNIPLLLSFATLGLGLFQARLVSWIFGVTLIILTILVGRQSFGNLGGFLAGLLLSVSPPFIQASHYARPDIMLAAVGMVCYYLVQIAFKKNYWWAHWLVGMLVSFAFDIHQNALLFAIGLGMLYLYNYRLQVYKQPGTWLFLLGCLIGAAYYALMYVVPHSGDVYNYFRFSLGISHQMPLSTLSPLSILKSFRAEIGRYHFFENSLDFVLIGASVVFLAFKPIRQNISILLFTGSVFLGFVLLVGNKHDIYAILLYAFFMLITAEALISLTRGGHLFTPQRAFLVALIGLFIVSSVIHLVRTVNENRNYDYYAITEQLSSVIPSNARVMGLPHWWLGLSDYDYQSSLGLTFLHFIKGTSLEEGFEIIKPDILIVDTGQQGLLVDQGYYNLEGFEFYRLPRQEFEAFLSKRGEKLLEFTDPWHGIFDVYSIVWDDAD